MTNSIEVWDRQRQAVFEESVPHSRVQRFLYSNIFGRLLLSTVLKRRVTNFLGGLYFGSGLSVDRIRPFVKSFGIDMSQFEETEYPSFNAFFARKFKDGEREFPTDPYTFPAFAEGRCLAFERISPTQTFPVKGYDLTPQAILGKSEQAEAFRHGPCLIVRLAPGDYHRYHYPDSGRHIGDDDLPGSLHSVSPFARARRG
ncbi:MAG: hypothetical protein F6K19_50580, partial [Cyanothece sp. SIO1E1]|nr:hypothetical protein [Cyanothece sp. SIO1E1]